MSTYRATDTSTWEPGEAVSGRQIPPRYLSAPEKGAGAFVPGDALWDEAIGVWRGVVAVRRAAATTVTITFEDGGSLGPIQSSLPLQMSETGLRGWSSAAAATAAFRAAEVG